jgi:small subunit ribosomal protein S20
MPNIKSAEKRIRSDAKKRERNQAAVSELKTLNKSLLSLANEPAKAQEAARELIARYDRAVSRGIIPRGRADRKKSRIAKFLAKLKHK